MKTLSFQYVSVSWDQSIRIWNAWRPPTKKRNKSAESSQATTVPADDDVFVDAELKDSVEAYVDEGHDDDVSIGIGLSELSRLEAMSFVGPSVPPLRNTRFPKKLS